MKTALDLAMERFGEPLKELSDKQKAALNEIENQYKAKTTEAEFVKNEKLEKANGDPQQIEQIIDDYTVEVASLNSLRDRDKEKVREQTS